MTKKTFKFPCLVDIKARQIKLSSDIIPFPFLLSTDESFWKDSIVTNCINIFLDEDDIFYKTLSIDIEPTILLIVENNDANTRTIYYIQSNSQTHIDNQKILKFGRRLK